MITTNRYPIYLPPIQEVSPLSQREIEILERSLLPDKNIADNLNISYHTVKSHLKNIKKKTGYYTTRQLVCYATKQGYIN